MLRRNRMLAILFAVVLTLSFGSLTAMAEADLNNAQTIDQDSAFYVETPYFYESGRTMSGLKPVMEIFEADYEWDDPMLDFVVVE